MAIRNIIKVGDPTLRKVSYPVSQITPKIIELLDDMKDTLIKVDGAGLAAPQVGVLRRIFIIATDDGIVEFINPKIIKSSGNQTVIEACLSVPNKQGRIERPKKIVLSAQDRFGEWFTITAHDFLAKAVCHEYDHLDGVLYIDKAISIEVPKE